MQKRYCFFVQYLSSYTCSDCSEARCSTFTPRSSIRANNSLCSAKKQSSIIPSHLLIMQSFCHRDQQHHRRHANHAGYNSLMKLYLTRTSLSTSAIRLDSSAPLQQCIIPQRLSQIDFPQPPPSKVIRQCHSAPHHQHK